MALAPQSPATPVAGMAVVNLAVEEQGLPNDPAGLKGSIPEDTDPEYKDLLEEEIGELEGYDWLTGQPIDPEADPAGKADPDPAPDPAPDPDPEPDPKASADPANPDPDPKADPKADPEPDPKADPDPDPEPAIATPDGKGTIPYATLQRERATSRALAAEVETLKARYEPGGQPPADPNPAPKADPDPKPEAEPEDAVARAQRIQAIRDLHGDEMADTIEGLTNTADQLSAKVSEQDQALDEARQREAQREADEAERSTEALQAAIDANPTVRGWLDDAIAAKNGEAGKSELAYNIAASIHEELAESDEFRDATFGERLEEVVRIVRGDSARPGTPEVSQDPDPAKADPDPTKDPDPKATADPATPKAEPKADPDPKPPETLSDLPSGDPHQSARERLEQMSPQEVEQAVLSGKMTLEAMEGMLLAE